ncbi:hypothetical protein HQQ80_20660, partial [Microbacteriaceae bacterium VKM Ac-2855]|nr:hypothetical protein [Microbacteriaceae bacterium VKM Ac-2855]
DLDLFHGSDAPTSHPYGYTVFCDEPKNVHDLDQLAAQKTSSRILLRNLAIENLLMVSASTILNTSTTACDLDTNVSIAIQMSANMAIDAAGLRGRTMPHASLRSVIRASSDRHPPVD